MFLAEGGTSEGTGSLGGKWGVSQGIGTGIGTDQMEDALGKWCIFGKGYA